MKLGGKEWLWIVAFYLGLTILIVTFLEFKALDRKIQKAIEQQGEINQKMYELGDKQSRSIRLIKTDTEIMWSIVMNGDYYEQEEK